MNILDSTLDRFPDLHSFYLNLGNTPLVRVPSPEGGAQIYAKLERTNPTGTIKDRTAFAMIADALAQVSRSDRDQLEILEYSGGSLAVSLADICARLKIHCRLVLSEATNSKIVEALKSYDVTIDWVDRDVGFLGVMMKAVEIARTTPARFLYQHENLANFQTHRNTTGLEITYQLAGRQVDAWVCAIGTGGTLSGVYSRLVEQNPKLKMYAVSPAEMPYGTNLPPNSLPKFAGSGGLGYGIRQSLVIPFEKKIEKHYRFSFEESSAASKTLHARLGFEVGTSAGANWLAAMNVASSLNKDQTVVTVFPS